MSKRCIQCGIELEDNAVFCDECGTRQPETTVKTESAVMDDKIQNQKKQSICGILSFALGLISVLTLGAFYVPEIAGIILGIIGIQDKAKKQGIAIAGLILSGIGVVMVVIILIAAVISEW